MSKQYIAMLCILAAIWGSSFMFIRVAVPYFGPLPLSAMRSLIGALALSPFLFGKGRLQIIKDHWPHLLVIGLISTAIPFSMLAISTKYTSAGFASILNALTPICSALIGWVWIKEKLRWQAILGIFLGFVGVTVLVLDKETINSSFPLLPVLAGLTGTFFYGLTGFYSRRHLLGIPSNMISACCQVSAAIFLLPVAYWLWPSTPIPLQSWLVTAVLGILCTGVAFILYFHLLEKVGVARTVLVTYLIPVFAILWGKLFLDESITLPMLAGAALILTGIGLSTNLFTSKARST